MLEFDYLLINFVYPKKFLNINTMNFISEEQQATIVKYVEPNYAGIQLLNLSRCAIGYVVRGTKYIHNGDLRYAISRGDVFYLGVGNHYIENIPDSGHNFEQIVVYYSPELLQKILFNLNINYSVNITSSHSCEQCRNRNHIAMPATSGLRNLFNHVTSFMREENFIHDAAAENIKMTELIYTIVAMDDCCLRSKLLNNIDEAYDSFRQSIYANIFNDISIEELASICHRSLTSFKKEFKRHFMMPPHRWFIQQRLIRSRLLLVSTSKSISEIGNECTFPNTSHFIKLFKKEYGTTPAIYRIQNSTLYAAMLNRSKESRKEKGTNKMQNSAI
jgi:AraC-like DNA-binding protein